MLGGSACHSTRVLPQDLAAHSVPQQVRPIRLTGAIYREQDSTMAIAGLEIVFRPQQPDSTTRGEKYLTQTDGGYVVTVLAGQSYRMAWRKDGQHGETQPLSFDASLSDTTRVHHNFYVPYEEDKCCIDSLHAPSLYFDTSSAALRPSSLARVNAALPLLHQFIAPAAQTQYVLVVVGHAEPYEVPRYHPAKAQYLQEIALKRALNTCRYLHAKGLPRQQLYVVSRGDQSPKLPNTNPEYRQVNRRVDLRLRYLPGGPTPNPAACYDAFVQRAVQSATSPTTHRARTRVLPARVPQHARK